MTQTPDKSAPIGLGICGLGMAGAVMVQAAAAHSGYALRAAADPHPAPREAFARDFNASAYADMKELAADPAVRAMRGMVARGELGRLGMINSFNYTNYLYRPRRPEELDTSTGGGILFNQVPHQIDTVRLLAGGLAKSVRAQANVLDPARPTEAGCVAFLQFEDGAAASLVYGGYDFFDTDEWQFGVAEGGTPKTIVHGAARQALAREKEEAGLRTKQLAYGARKIGLPEHQPHFGVTIVTCAGGEMRASADGVLVYGRDGVREVPLPRSEGMPGRQEVLDDMAAAIRTGKPPLHDGRWGKATLEVALALLRSAREGREITLAHQVGVPEQQA
jgi:phthalate 4,5-cis-dihydrodiol dehydrogenase